MVEVRNSESNLPRHFAINCFPHESLRQPVFTGPDGLYPHRSHRLLDRRPLGTNPYTREATWDTDYLWRAPPTPPVPAPAPTQGLPAATYGPTNEAHGQPFATLEQAPATVGVPVHLRPRSSFAGEIGWHQFAFRSLYPEAAWTGHQILTSEFRRDLEDRWTHRYQNPWYPGEGERPDPSREGAYFGRFPASGQRARTSHDDFRNNKSHSHSASSRTSKDQQRPWRRAPAATPLTTYGTTQDAAVRSDADAGGGEVVSVEQSEDGDAGGGGGVAGDGVERARSSRTCHHTGSSTLPLHKQHAPGEPLSRVTSNTGEGRYSRHSQRSDASTHSQRQQHAHQE